MVWKSSKESTTAQHATEAEYIAAFKAAKEAVWIRKFINKLCVVPLNDYLIKINCDNSATIIMAKESGIQKGARHFQTKYHYVHECIETGEIDIVKVYTYDNLADLFTKALAGPKLTRHARSMGLRSASSFIDDVYKWATLLSSFYAVFDGHRGAKAASYVKEHAMRLFFESSNLPEATTTLDGLVDEFISDYCGTTALTVLVLERHLLISNAGDCRVFISRKGVAKQMSNDHRPSDLLEMKRVEELGGYFEEGYLNGELAVTRALGDKLMKLESPLIDC
nr:probable protein phosphatase 2C 47 [Tanacetum cinerariifolium]